MRLRRPTYVESQALAFITACVVLGGMVGAVVAAAKGGLR